MSEREYYLGFSLFSGVGPKRFVQLLNHFGTAESAWEASSGELESVIGKVFTTKFLSFRETFDFHLYEKQLKKADVSFVTIDDEAYPSLLKQIENPPFVLFYKGDKNVLESGGRTVGIVGTRKITSYGRHVTEMITEELVRAGCVIVSGLALGVDAVTHQATIENKGKTIAVLGCGVDCCNPTTNTNLYNRIIDSGGAVVSEFPLSHPPSVGSFPSRNRIIAGLSEVVVVTEGAEDSGALITAEDALKVGRTVFAVPGQITSHLAKGPLKLLQQGAKLATSGEDILKELGVGQSGKSKAFVQIKGETEEEQKIIDLLQNESLLFDQIVNETKRSAQEIGQVLSLMEVKGFITRDGERYSIIMI